MHFTIGAPGKLLRATYVPHRWHIEVSDGRPHIKVGHRGSALDNLQWEFRDCWIIDQYGRSHPPLAKGAE